MMRWLLEIMRVLTFFVRRFFFWKSARNSNLFRAEKDDKALRVFEDENQIVHSRLSHFPAQIGRWGISLKAKNRK
jgi:hypothetical protein